MPSICVMCELEKFSIEKILEPGFIEERKNEFYPDDEYGHYAHVCPIHYEDLIAQDPRYEIKIKDILGIE